MTVTTKGAAGFIPGGATEGAVADEKEPKPSNYEVLTGFCLGGARNVWPGDVIELSEADGRRFMGLMYVTPTDKKAGPAPKQKHRKDVIQNRDPQGIRNQDPK